MWPIVNSSSPGEIKSYDYMSRQCNYHFLHSDAFFLLLSNLTGLKLHQLAPEDSDSEEEKEDGAEKEEKVYNPRCRGGLARWGPGNYTLIRDDDQEQAEYALDLRICFNVSSGEESEAGGQSVYIARGEDEELVTVTPEENTLSLVYRYVGETQQISRLVNLSSIPQVSWGNVSVVGVVIFQSWHTNL